MKARKFFQYLFHCSYSKTLLINIRHLGFRGIFKPVVLIAKGVKIKNFKGELVFHSRPRVGCIRIGFAMTPFNRSTVIDCRGVIHFYGKAVLGKGCVLNVAGDSELILGNNFRMIANSSIICYKRISFGNDCLISWDNLIMDTDFHKIYYDGKYQNQNAEIRFDDNVWVCCRCTILKGSYIPANCVVSAGSTISGQYHVNNAIIATGHKILKENITWTR